MAYRYSSISIELPQSVFGASLTNNPVGQPFRVSHAGSLNVLIGIECSGVTAGAGITAKLQSSLTGSDWLDGNSVSVTGNGWFYIRMNVQASGDQAKLPLGDVGRLVLTTGAGSAITVVSAYVSQGL